MPASMLKRGRRMNKEADRIINTFREDSQVGIWKGDFIIIMNKNLLPGKEGGSGFLCRFGKYILPEHPEK